jgi:drug/metabolite transporter (DMT)-like permease
MTATHAVSRTPAFAALLVVMALWGSTSAVAKLMLDSFAPIMLNWLRWFIIALIAAPFAWSERAALWEALRTRWRTLLLLILLGGSLQSSVVFFGLSQSSAIHLGLFNSAIPVMILTLGWLFFGEALHAKEAIGVTISAVGVVVIFFQGSMEVLRSLSVLPGDPILLAGMLLWAIYSLSLNRRPANISLITLMFVIAVASVPLAAPLVWWEWRSHPLPVLTWPLATGLLYLAAITNLGAMLLYGFAIKRIGPMQASLFIHIMPLFAVLFASLFVGEQLHWYHAAGFVLVASGAIIGCYRPAPALSTAK